MRFHGMMLTIVKAAYVIIHEIRNPLLDHFVCASARSLDARARRKVNLGRQPVWVVLILTAKARVWAETLEKLSSPRFVGLIYIFYAFFCFF